MSKKLAPMSESQDESAMDKVMRCVASLYEEYYRSTSDVSSHRMRIEEELSWLMTAWDEYLG